MASHVKIALRATSRGFLRGEFRDANGDAASIQESSQVEARLWLGADRGTHADGQCLARMHLTRAHARALLPLLQRFADQGDLRPLRKAPAPAAAAADLSLAILRDVNVRRCVNGFGHALDSWSTAEWTNALCGEAGEAANVAKKMLRHRDQVPGNSGEDTDIAILLEKLARELADVVIYADLVAASIGVDLGQAVRETFNRKSDEIGAEERL